MAKTDLKPMPFSPINPSALFLLFGESLKSQSAFIFTSEKPISLFLVSIPSSKM